MNKKDLIPVIALVLMIPLWLFIDRHYLAPKFASKNAATAEQPVAQSPEEGGTNVATVISAATTNAPATTVEKAKPAVVEPPAEEVVGTLKNDEIKLELTSLGGGIKSATLTATDKNGKILYPELNEDNSLPVVLSFTNTPALAYEGINGLGASNSFNLKVADDEKSAVLTKQLPNMLFKRTITLGNDYKLNIQDRFIATSSSACKLPSFRMLTGHMENPADMKAMRGLSILGVDSYTTSDGVYYWGRKLNKLFKHAGQPETLDMVPQDMQGKTVDWVAAKNKFFTQIISLKKSSATMAILSSRDPSVKGTLPKDIAAALVFKPTTIDAGNSLEYDYTYYIGPKQYSALKAAGNHMEDVMEFKTIGNFSWMNWLMEPSRKALLWTLNLFDGIFHNYGVAIILLTLLVRILFWPLTHKSTESMQRMQELQPEIKALQAKYKSNPQRMQQETMKLYKEKKVNPMGGCLPMFVQIPVFFALYTVLRNAIELRYAHFLWIADLSAPENLFMGKVPVVGALNILPIAMAASMIWQQKINSPATAATPEQQQQQKMMMFMMPFVMLFILYNMPSGLCLYWTTSNLLMIAQTAIRNVRKKVAAA